MNNNDTSNNNLNGTVLGSVGNNPNVNNNPMPTDNVETLDGGFTATPINNVQNMDNNLGQAQNTFFTNPPVNDMNINNQGMVNESPQPYVQATPQVEPTPAYTNPQTINQPPMPGFENSGTIGTTPPISFEPEKQPKKKTNKTLFIIIVLVVLAGVGFGTYYVLNYTDLLKKTEQINVVANNIEVNMGEELSTTVSDYATITGTDSRNCSLDTKEVDINTAGVYKYTVTCGETVKSGEITVVDNTELVVETKAVYKANGDTIDPKEFIKTLDDTVTYEFVDSEAVNNYLAGAEGTYTIKIKATAKNNKTVEVDAKLVIMQYAIKGYLVCSSSGQNVSNANMVKSEKFAIVDDGNNGYGKIASETYTFTFTDETEYTNHLATYKTDGKVTINNITGDTSFDDEKLTITITNEKDNQSVISEYGENNLTNYSTIKSYFETTKGYKCIYEKSEMN